MTLPSELNIGQENSEYQAQCHSLLSFQLCLSFCAPLKAIFLGRSVLMLWSFSVYTSFSSTSFTSCTALTFTSLWFMGHHLLHKILHCNLAKVLLFAIGMQVRRTIYCLKSPFLDQVLSMHHQQDCLCLSYTSIGLHQSVLALLYSISHKNFKYFCGASDICKHHLTVCSKPFCNIPKI